MIKPLKRKAYLIKSLNQQWSQKCRSISIRRIVIRWIVVSRGRTICVHFIFCYNCYYTVVTAYKLAHFFWSDTLFLDFGISKTQFPKTYLLKREESKKKRAIKKFLHLLQYGKAQFLSNKSMIFTAFIYVWLIFQYFHCYFENKRLLFWDSLYWVFIDIRQKIKGFMRLF